MFNQETSGLGIFFDYLSEKCVKTGVTFVKFVAIWYRVPRMALCLQCRDGMVVVLLCGFHVER